MSKLLNTIELEDSKATSSPLQVASKAPRRKYKQKMSLWSKSKGEAGNTLSVDVSTKSSQGYSSMGVLANKTSSVSIPSSPISAQIYIKIPHLCQILEQFIVLVTGKNLIKFG